MTQITTIETYEQYEQAAQRINRLYSDGLSGTPEAQELAGALTTYEREVLGIEHRDGWTFSLEWYVGKVADAEAKKARIQAQADAMIADEDRFIRSLQWRYGALAERALRESLKGRARSVKFLTGTISLRAVPARVSVTDQETLVQSLPTDLYLEVVETKVSSALLNKAVKVTGDHAYRADTGEQLSLEGLSVTPASEKVTVKIEKEKP